MTTAPELSDEIDKLEKRIDDLEECLAGFMAVVGLNGVYLPDEMINWIDQKLKGSKARTQSQFWRELVIQKELVKGKEKT